MVVRRGDLYWAALREPAGSEPGYRRPVVVVQSDDFNQSRIRTVLVLTVTSNLLLLEAPGNVLLPEGETGLNRDSVANVSQVVTLDRSFLHERIGHLPATIMAEIDRGLRQVLSL